MFRAVLYPWITLVALSCILGDKFCFGRNHQSNFLKRVATRAGKKFCDWESGCSCFYFADPCPNDFRFECRDRRYCNLEKNKPCCSSNEVECNNSTIDLLYVVDGSGSVGVTNFDEMKNFLKRLNKRFEIGTDKVRIAVEQYSNLFKYHVQLREASKNDNLEDLDAVIDSMPFDGGATYTGEALQNARRKMFIAKEGDRVDAPDILILFTDGVSSDGDLQFEEADKLKAKGVTIMTVGIGSGANEDDLKRIASTSYDGQHKLTYMVDFSELLTIANDIVHEACNHGQSK